MLSMVFGMMTYQRFTRMRYMSAITLAECFAMHGGWSAEAVRVCWCEDAVGRDTPCEHAGVRFMI